jgi:hypothetical protein
VTMLFGCIGTAQSETSYFSHCFLALSRTLVRR